MASRAPRRRRLRVPHTNSRTEPGLELTLSNHQKVAFLPEVDIADASQEKARHRILQRGSNHNSEVQMKRGDCSLIALTTRDPRTFAKCNTQTCGQNKGAQLSR